MQPQSAMAEPGETMTEPMFSLRKEDLVTLLVGPHEEQLAVHESCITRNSDFFKAAMKKEWIEGQMRTIMLPEETSVESFVNYLNFSYHGKLPTEDIKTWPAEGLIGHPYSELAKLCVIGERMIDRSVQEAAVREFMRLTKIKSSAGPCQFPGMSCIRHIYDGTTLGSPMRRLMVDFYVTHGLTNWPYQGQHPEFLGDLAEELQGKIMAQKLVRDFRDLQLVAKDCYR